MRCISGWVSAAIQNSIRNHTNCSKSCGKFSKISETISKLHLDRKTPFLVEKLLYGKLHLMKWLLNICSRYISLHQIVSTWFFGSGYRFLKLLINKLICSACFTCHVIFVYCSLRGRPRPWFISFSYYLFNCIPCFLCVIFAFTYFLWKVVFLDSAPRFSVLYFKSFSYNFCFFLKDFLIPSFGKHSL